MGIETCAPFFFIVESSPDFRLDHFSSIPDRKVDITRQQVQYDQLKNPGMTAPLRITVVSRRVTAGYDPTCLQERFHD
ncbi:MAG TPA: hypothetical protein VK638_52555 [Edaphobacter sp.]|nr:hypothetical protein [Edaphobacter sp.]